MKHSHFLIVALLICTCSNAQPKPSLVAAVDRNKIFIGEQFDLILDARFANAASITFVDIDSIPHFEIVKKSKIDTSSVGGEVLLSQRITLTSWDSGRWQLPSFNNKKSGNGTAPLSIEVSFSPMDPKQDYHDVKDVIAVQGPAETTWYWYVIGAALLLLLFILLFPKKKKKEEPPAVVIDAYKVAISELKKLRQEQHSMDAKLFYVELVDLFRKYLHQKKDIQSFSKTTDDLALQIRELNMPSSLYHQLVQTLSLSDAVKFARLLPTDAERKESIEVIHKSIDVIEQS
ncbi:MAG TPA: LPXTG cell wall anchor domain-containing protein [Chitinophagaceae bacterium]|nr:LPXTG cell wall anchor domain-containing protein [Chitinophagaceae bacterium]